MLCHRLVFFLCSFAAILGGGSLAVAARVDDNWAPLGMAADGSVSLGGLSFSVGYYGPGWQSYVQQNQLVVAKGFPARNESEWRTQGILPAPAAGVPGPSLSQVITRPDGKLFRLRYEVRKDENPLPTENGIFLQLTLSAAQLAGQSVIVDGQSRLLPELFGDAWLFSATANKPHTLVVPSGNGTLTLSGVFGLHAQDLRKWGKDAFALRLRFPPAQALVDQASLELDLDYAPHASVPVSLREAANRGFSDEVEGDGKGGWTDQGPGNDLAILPSGLISAAGIEFDVVDETANGGRSALVLGRLADGRTGDLVTKARLAVAGRPAWRNLYLLHAAAWLPSSGEELGRIRVINADGSETVREIVSGQDVGNWWAPSLLPNAIPGWTGQNPSSAVGLYVTKLPLPGKAVESIVLEGGGAGSLWMVAAVSGSINNIVPVTLSEPWVAKPGPDWMPYEHSLDIQAGSVFDFSFLAEAPAGKYGPVIASKEGHFEFAGRPGVRARFWGVNLNFSSCFLEPELADQLAERLVRSGYNTVRFHHFERELLSKAPGAASHELDPDQLDRLDYLFAALKRRGIYINIDLYASRPLKPEELASLGFGERTSTSAPELWFKAMIPVSDKAFELWKPFARELLTHRNPHTGLTWMEDPALIGICPVNEDSPPDSYSPGDAVIRKAYEQALVGWREKPGNQAAYVENPTRTGNRFVYEQHIVADARRESYLREMGVKTLLTGANFKSAQGLAFLREHYDYVDNHSYWDHPDFPGTRWKLPFSFSRGSAVRLTAQVPRTISPSRILGKPFAVTEFHFVRPNRFRAEGGVIMPAYASLQDWGVLYNFEYSWGRQLLVSGGAAGVFSLAADPIGLLSDRVAALVFLRGDVAPAPRAIGFAVEADTAFASRERAFPDSFSQLGLVTRIGSRARSPQALQTENEVAAVVVDAESISADPAKGVYPADRNLQKHLLEQGVLPPGSIEPEKQRFRSETGEIELDASAGTMRVVAPRSELFVMPGQSRLGDDGRGRVQVRNGASFGTVSVVSIDGRPLEESARILVVHLTEALPTGTRFGSASRQLLEANGELPHLVERGQVELTLNLAAEASYQAWAVSSTGARQRVVPLQKTSAGEWILQAETVTPEGTCLAYEIVRNP